MAEADLNRELAMSGYEPLRPLASGGMGEVHVVRERVSGVVRVMKIVKQLGEHQEEVARRTVAEGRALASLRHPNIVELCDAGVTRSGRAFLVMELLEGRTLREMIDARGALPIEEVVGVLREVLMGLEAAHGRGLVHRDIKPANLFVVEGAANARTVKILDFGIAKAVSEGAKAGAGSALVATRAGFFLGSPNYMAPEQSAGLTVDARADIYAVGAVGFHMLVGRAPFRGLSIEAIVREHHFAAIPVPSAFREGVRAELDAVIVRALAKTPRERFSSAAEMLQALDAAVRPHAQPHARQTMRMQAAPPAGVPGETVIGPVDLPVDVSVEGPVDRGPPVDRSPRRAPAASSAIDLFGAAIFGFLVAIAIVLLLVIAGWLRISMARAPDRGLRAAGFFSGELSGRLRGGSMIGAADTIPQAVQRRLTSGGYLAINADTIPEDAIGAGDAGPSPEELGRAATLPSGEAPRGPRTDDAHDAQDFKRGEIFRGCTMGGLFARGGMSLLYEAVHASGQPALVKVLKEHYRHSSFRHVQDKLVAEGELLALARGASEFLPRGYEFGTDRKVGPFVVLERLEGKSLDAHLLALRAVGKRFEPATAVKICVRALQGLHLMHLTGAVHRDIKPGNLFVAKGNVMRVVLLDWGAAKSVYSPATSFETAAVGTAGYMAPEQILKGTATGAIDQYALGVTLYEMCFRHPFAIEERRLSSEDLLRAHLLVEPPTPATHAVPPRLWETIKRSLAKDPRHRYPSCEAFADALLAWLAAPDAPTQAPSVLNHDVRPTVPKEGARAVERTPRPAPIEAPKPAKRIAVADLSERASLLVRHGRSAGARFELGDDREIVGRHPGFATIVLDDEGLSQKHAAIEVVVYDPENPVYNVTDLGSTNGTSVGGRLLSSGLGTDELPIIGALRAGEAVIMDRVELTLLPAGRLLPSGAWQSLRDAKRAPAPAAAPVKGGTVKLAAVSPAGAPAPAVARRIAQRPAVEMETQWLAPTLLVMMDRGYARFHLGPSGVIGASADAANIVVDERHVSSAHVRYTHVTGALGPALTVLFEDLGSTNGTFDRDPVAEPGAASVVARAVHPMQSLWIGRGVELMLLPPGRFTADMQFVACDASGRPLVGARGPKAGMAPSVTSPAAPVTKTRRIVFACAAVVLLAIIVGLTLMASGISLPGDAR